VIRRLLVGLAVLSLAACTSSGSPAAAPSVGPPCLPTGPSASPASPTTPLPNVPLPKVKLSCFVGGAPADLATLGGPAIVNLWGTWCPPCRKELPAIQRYAEQAGDRVRVIGVITRDERDSAQSFIDEEKVTLPMLYDPEQRLLLAVGKRALPVTLFITAGGRLAYVYNSTALSTEDVAELAERYLGVTVPA
jgi:thiol-disulfide isomerase/thioredoxin